MENGHVGPSPLVDFLAGTAGGIASLVVGQPFDTIKTRLQAQSHGSTASSVAASSVDSSLNARTPLLSEALSSRSINSSAIDQPPRMNATGHTATTALHPPRYYTSATDAFRVIVREEKFFGLFKGITSPLLGVAAMNACIFGSYGLALRAQTSDGTADSSRATLGQILLAGCASGVISALITTPIELIKVREQLDFKGQGARPQTWSVVKDLWRKDARGIRGLYRGLGATCLRDIGYGPYFLSYEVFNRVILSLRSATPLAGEEPQLSNVDMALSGALAGVLAWVSTFPIDCIKTRVQATDLIDGQGKSSVAHAARSIWREGGFPAFWRGVGATVLRAIPVNAALFVVYETTKDALTRKGY